MNAFLLDLVVKFKPFSQDWLVGVDSKDNYMLSISPEEKQQMGLKQGPSPFLRSVTYSYYYYESNHVVLTHTPRGDIYMSKEIGFKNYELVEFMKYTRTSDILSDSISYFVSKYNLSIGICEKV